MSAKGTERNSVSRAIADLEAVDAALARWAPAEPADDASAAIGAPVREARALLRAAIEKLTAAQPVIDETATSKRRVKIKAVGDAAAPAEPAKGGTKSGSRRKTPEPIEKAPTSSLLARLGAAMPEPPEATPPPSTPEASEAASPAPDRGISAEDAADRLARLEAEIESLTRPPSIAAQAVAAAHNQARNAAVSARDSQTSVSATASRHTAPPANGSATSASRAPLPETDYEDDDDIEVTIIGGKADPRGRAIASDRTPPRVLRHAGPGADDDADVEIVRPGAAPRHAEVAPQSDEGLRIDPTSPHAPAKGSAPSRWRLFRGTR